MKTKPRRKSRSIEILSLKAMSLIAISLAPISAQCDGDELDNMPEHWYKFNGDTVSSGMTAFSNSSTFGPTSFTSSPGGLNNAAVIPSGALWTSNLSLGDGDWTIATSCKFNSTDKGVMWSIGGANNAVDSRKRGLALAYVSGNPALVWWQKNGQNPLILVDTEIGDATERYHSYAVQYVSSRAEVYLYVDGELVGSAEQSMVNNEDWEGSSAKSSFYAVSASSGIEIARTGVTNADYDKFMAATGASAPKYWPAGEIPEGRDDHPVVWVSYSNAVAYCEWLTANDEKYSYRLPTKDEWKEAAGPTPSDAQFNYNYVIASQVLAEVPTRLVTYIHDKSTRKGEQDQLNEVISITASGGVKGWVDHANYTGFIYTDLFKEINDAGGNTTSVETYATTVTASGAIDMWGNCWEWTSTVETATNGAEAGQDVNVVMGGSWYANRSSCLTSMKGEGRKPGTAYNTVGFRVVRESL